MYFNLDSCNFKIGRVQHFPVMLTPLKLALCHIIKKTFRSITAYAYDHKLWTKMVDDNRLAQTHCDH